MKLLVLISLVVFSFSACSKEAAKKIKTAKSAEVTKAVDAKAIDPKAEAPCDSKEDILKKLEEKKKTEAEKGKGFSLQGGNTTGCSVK